MGSGSASAAATALATAGSSGISVSGGSPLPTAVSALSAGPGITAGTGRRAGRGSGPSSKESTAGLSSLCCAGRAASAAAARRGGCAASSGGSSPAASILAMPGRAGCGSGASPVEVRSGAGAARRGVIGIAAARTAASGVPSGIGPCGRANATASIGARGAAAWKGAGVKIGAASAAATGAATSGVSLAATGFSGTDRRGAGCAGAICASAKTLARPGAAARSGPSRPSNT